MTTSSKPGNAAVGYRNVRDIMKLLPHRYPFLLIDRVIRIESGKFVDAYKCVSVNEPYFQGHFPDLPVMPGVLTLEALAQAGGVLVLSDLDEDFLVDNIFLFSGIEKVKFRRPVYPGDRLDMRCELVKQKMRIWKMKGTATVDGVLACEAELTAALMRKADI